MVGINHNLFIHSSIDGCLGCFLIFAIVNNSAMNMGICIFFELEYSFSSDIYTKVEFQNHMEVLFLIFWGPSIQFSQKLHQSTFLLSTTNWHLPRALPTTEQQRHLPSASMETEPHAAIAVAFNNPREFREEGGTLCSRESLDSWMCLGTDFMISILASPPI